MKLMRGIVTLALVVALAGCASSPRTIAKLNRANPAGSPFTKQLAAEYREFANGMQGASRLYSPNAYHFARKGLAAADGLLVMPEPVDGWNLDVDGLAEAAEARADLVSTLDGGGRDMAPREAAIAQSRFDCWIADSSLPCKDQFRTALDRLKAVTVGAMPPDMPVAPDAEPGFPAPIADSIKGEVVPIQNAAFMVFFDWDRYDLTASAQSVLDAIATELKGRKDVKQVVVVGHADTSGPEKYNLKLSMKRADAVRKALISRSLSAEMVRTEGRGETDLLVPTADNVRQPENRRAAITLE